MLTLSSKNPLGTLLVVAVLGVIGLSSAALPSDKLADEVKIVSPGQPKPASASQIAAQNILALNKAMMPIYDSRFHPDDVFRNMDSHLVEIDLCQWRAYNPTQHIPLTGLDSYTDGFANAGVEIAAR